MDSCNEKTSMFLTLTFSNENGVGVTPNSATYRIDDLKSGTVIKTTTAIVPSSSTYELEIEATLNEMVDELNEREIRLVTVEFDYGVSPVHHGTNEYVYTVKQLKGVSST